MNETKRTISRIYFRLCENRTIIKVPFKDPELYLRARVTMATSGVQCTGGELHFAACSRVKAIVRFLREMLMRLSTALYFDPSFMLQILTRACEATVDASSIVSITMDEQSATVLLAIVFPKISDRAKV